MEQLPPKTPLGFGGTLCFVALLSISVSSVFGTESLIIPPEYATIEGGGGSGMLSGLIRGQALYSSNYFPSAILVIREIRMRPSVVWGHAFTGSVANIKIKMCATTTSASNPSSVFTNNFGSDLTPVFDGTLNISSSFSGPSSGPKAFDIRIPLMTPFRYDPRAGNLLIEYRNYTGGNVSATDARLVNSSPGTRVLNLNPDATQATAIDIGVEILQLVYDLEAVGPSFLTQPVSQSVPTGASVTFTGSASGTPLLVYQWFFNDGPINDATQAVLVLPNVQLADAGTYSLSVSNSAGSITSSNATLEVQSNLVSLIIPPEYANIEGQGGSRALGAPIRGQTLYSSNYFPTGVLVIREIRMRPSAVWGQAFTGSVANIKIKMCTTIASASSPSSVFTNNFGPDLTSVFDGTLNVSSSFTGPPSGPKAFDISIPLTTPFTYDPRVGNLLIEYRNYTGGNVSAVDARVVNTSPGTRVLNLNPDATQATAIDIGVEILQLVFELGSLAPSFVTQPVSQTVETGDSVTFTGSASGTPPLAYQWFFNESPISDATQPTLSLTNVRPTDAGAYTLSVSNLAGSITSSNATLDVLTNLVRNSLIIPPEYANIEGLGGSRALGAPIRGQTLYSSNYFPAGFLSIREIRMRPSAVWGEAFTGSVANIKIKMCTTTTSASSPSSIFTNNLGPDLTSVFDGTLNVSSSFTGPPSGPKAFDIKIPLTTPFAYDPRAGNLLIEYRNYTGGNVSAVDARVVNTSPGTRVLNLNPDATQATAIDIGVEILEIIYDSEPIQPHIAIQPADTTVTVGDSASFMVSAQGTQPLYYQWFFGGTPIEGATDPTLVLTNTQRSQAGSYFVTVSNRVASITSSNAMLTVKFPPALVRIFSTPAASGASVVVPVELVGNGNENALGFSLQFDPALLQFTGAARAGGAAKDAALLVNDANAASGRLGLALALPAGATFPAGTQQVVTIGFDVAPVLNPVTIALTMSDQPTTRQVSDTQAVPLPAVFQGGSVSISRVDFEGDVAPRPDGDHALTIIDWVQVGRFVAGLDQVSDAEFQRADCAPRARLGNGVLSITDWVQAGRYAAGLDPLTPVGGPVQPSESMGLVTGTWAALSSTTLSGYVNTSIQWDPGTGNGHPPPLAQPMSSPLTKAALSLGGVRALSLPQTNILPGNDAVTLAVRLEAQGDENALGFSVAFDSACLQFLGAARAAAASNAMLNLNTNQAATGRIGVALALPPGDTFGAGTMNVVLLFFEATSSACGMAAISFGDLPIVREVSDAQANPLPAAYNDGSILVGAARPSLGLTHSGPTVLLFWPSTATGFVLQATSGPLGTPWTNVETAPLDFGGQKLVPLPVTGSEKYFRLKQP